MLQPDDALGVDGAVDLGREVPVGGDGLADERPRDVEPRVADLYAADAVGVAGEQWVAEQCRDLRGDTFGHSLGGLFGRVRRGGGHHRGADHRGRCRALALTAERGEGRRRDDQTVGGQPAEAGQGGGQQGGRRGGGRRWGGVGDWGGGNRRDLGHDCGCGDGLGGGGDRGDLRGVGADGGGRDGGCGLRRCGWGGVRPGIRARDAVGGDRRHPGGPVAGTPRRGVRVARRRGGCDSGPVAGGGATGCLSRGGGLAGGRGVGG